VTPRLYARCGGMTAESYLPMLTLAAILLLWL
jgi:hypothetical protein